MVRIARLLPSPMAYAMILTLVALAAALAVGERSSLELLDAWAAGGSGFWSFLGFGMQMTLILVTGTVVAESRPVRALLTRIATLPIGARSAPAMIAVISMLTALVHWGLGLIVGAVLAREIGRACTNRGVPTHYPALAAAGYCGLLVWHGGLSGSAPLKVTTEADVIEVLGAEVAAAMGTLTLWQTTLSPRNLMVTGALLVVLPIAVSLLVPRDAADFVQPPGDVGTDEPEPLEGSPVDTTPVLSLLFAGLMGAWVVRWIGSGGLASMNPDALNFVFFALGLALAGSPAAYMQLARRGADAATGILVQFPLYAGIRGILVVSGLGAALVSLGSDQLLLSTFLSAGLLNLFIPSGGGQWGIQGPIAMAEAVRQGIEPARIVLAIAWGDQWTNAFQPFWALPLLGITGTRAGDLLVNTGVLGIVAGVIMLVGVLL